MHLNVSAMQARWEETVARLQQELKDAQAAAEEGEARMRQVRFSQQAL